MYDNILVPTDGSPAAAVAIDHAVDIASTYGATVHGLYIVDVGAYSSIEPGTEMVVDALEEEGRAAVADVEEVAEAAGVDVETAVLTGTAYRGILDYVDDHDIDLVVMGTHGRRGLERYLLGSVTERVVRSADVPVMTVREPDAE